MPGQIAVTGYFTFGQSISGPVAGSNFYSIRDSVSHTRGRHTLKFGGEISLDKTIQQTLLNNYGTFSFNGTKAANALADFALGLPVTMNQDSPVDAYNNFFTSGLFAQDDFRVNKRLTLNLGLRYELQTSPTDPQDRIAVFIAGRQSKVIPNARADPQRPRYAPSVSGPSPHLLATAARMSCVLRFSRRTLVTRTHRDHAVVHCGIGGDPL